MFYDPCLAWSGGHTVVAMGFYEPSSAASKIVLVDLNDDKQYNFDTHFTYFTEFALSGLDTADEHQAEFVVAGVRCGASGYELQTRRIYLPFFAQTEAATQQ